MNVSFAAALSQGLGYELPIKTLMESATPRVSPGGMLPREGCPDADQLPRPLLLRERPRSRSLGAPEVGPWDGLSSPRRCNPAVKQAHGEAEEVAVGRRPPARQERGKHHPRKRRPLTGQTT